MFIKKQGLFFYRRFIKYRKKINEQYQTYFSECHLKNSSDIKKEMIDWIKANGEFNDFYYLYGLDVFGSQPDLYLDNKSFMRTRNEMALFKKENSQISILRDKYLFYKYMASCKLKVPEVYAVLIRNRLFDGDMNTTTIDALFSYGDFFAKDINGECASFVRHIKKTDDYLKIINDTNINDCIMQKKVIQSKEMDLINPYAINTLRIVTVYNDGNPFVLTSLLRVGTKASEPVDNWAAGGLAIGIEKNGFLKEYGFYKPIHGTKTNIHPDTGIVFKNFKVPLYNEAINMVLNAHKYFYNIETIGWDVAITDDGPFIIEGNDNWEISLMQACDRPLKDEWTRIYNNWQLNKK